MRRVLISLTAFAAFAACGMRNEASRPVDPAQSAVSVAPGFSADSAYSNVADQVALGPRNPGSPGHTACARMIEQRLRTYGADSVWVHKATTRNYLGEQLQISNIFARYNPQASRRILLVAHWDTRPWADEDPEAANRTKPLPGANDGASGTAVLLELARMMGQQAPDCGVDLLFVDAEDSGRSSGPGYTEDTWCLGTQEWLKSQPYAPGEAPAYGILLDMVGGRGARFYREYTSQRMAPAVVDRIWATAAATGMGDRFPNIVRGAVTDDHTFLNAAGIPTADIIECASDATGSFPPGWHTMADDLEAIDASTLGAVGQTVANVIYSEPSK